MPKKEKRNRCKVLGKWYKRAEPIEAAGCLGCYPYTHYKDCDPWPTCLPDEREGGTECIWVLDRKYGKKGKAK